MVVSFEKAAVHENVPIVSCLHLLDHVFGELGQYLLFGLWVMDLSYLLRVGQLHSNLGLELVADVHLLQIGVQFPHVLLIHLG